MNASSWSFSCASKTALYYNSFNLNDKKQNLTPLTHSNLVLLSRGKPLLPLLMTLPVRGAGPITARPAWQQPMSGGEKHVSQSGAYTVTFPVDGCGHDTKTGRDGGYYQHWDLISNIIKSNYSYITSK